MKKDVNAQGRFPFEKLTKFYSLDQINQAAPDSERGGTIKPIIRLSAAGAAELVTYPVVVSTVRFG
jgi:hypothetical protein